MAPPVTIPAKPEGAKGTQLAGFTSIPPTTRKVRMAPIFTVTMMLLVSADSFTPRTSSSVRRKTMRKPGRLKYAPVHCPPAQTGLAHFSGKLRPKTASCAFVYQAKPTATATFETTYSRMRSPAVLPVRTKLMITSSAWACRRDGAWKYSPAAAVPVSIKMPEPMMAPMPSAVSDQGPRDLLSRCSGFSESEISLSMDLQQRSWLSEVRTDDRMVAAGSGDGCDKRLWSPGVSCQLSAFSYQLSAL